MLQRLTGCSRCNAGHGGHRISCIAISRAHSFIISGSGPPGQSSVVLWDTDRPRLIRVLCSGLPMPPPHLIPTEAGANIVVCSARQIRVISINGVPLAGLEMDAESDAFTCATPVSAPDWSVEYPTIVSGHADGCIRFWRLVPTRMPNVKRWGKGWRQISSHCGQTLEFVTLCARSHNSPVTSISFSSDSPPSLMFTGGEQGGIVQWGRMPSDRRPTGKDSAQ